MNARKSTSPHHAFEAAEAQRVIQCLEFSNSPKHGSWVDVAEIEFSVFGGQCLNRRIGDAKTLNRLIAALETERNQISAKVNWSFSTVEARRKLRHSYQSISN